MDYPTLVAQISSYFKRTDTAFTEQIPNFIQQGINRIYLETKNIGFETVVNGNLVVNNPLLPKPANWRETVSFRITDNRLVPPETSFLLLRTKDYCQTVWNKPTQTEKPIYYADFGYANFYFAPTPEYAYPFELICFTLPLFNGGNPTNFLTVRYPQLLLYSCILEGLLFTKDDGRLPAVQQGFYAEASKAMNASAQKLYADRTSNRGKD